MNYSDDFREMIKKYNEELRKMSRKSKSETVLAQSNAVEQKSDNDLNRLQEILTPEEKQEAEQANQFPFSNSYELPSIEQNQIIKGQTENLSGMGHLIVRVFTAKQASPVLGATVMVAAEDASGERLINTEITNASGETPTFDLPTVPESESLTPGVKNPYASYKIKVSAPGYFTIDSINVPIFDKQDAVQPVEMVPMPEGYEGNQVLSSVDTGPIDLQ